MHSQATVCLLLLLLLLLLPLLHTQVCVIQFSNDTRVEVPLAAVDKSVYEAGIQNMVGGAEISRCQVCPRGQASSTGSGLLCVVCYVCYVCWGLSWGMGGEGQFGGCVPGC